MTDKNPLDLAREWAKKVSLREKITCSVDDETLAVALHILAVTAPTPRTMDEIEWDDEHQGLEAVYGAGSRWESVVRMLCPMEHNGRDAIVCVEKSGRVFNPYPRDLTPLPGTKINLTPTSSLDDEGGKRSPFYAAARAEIDRLNQRGGEGKPAPESDAPRPEDVPVGEPWQVEVGGAAAIGYRNDPEARICWGVVFQDEDNHAWVCDSDVTLIARLVPEATERDAVPEFDPVCTYRDREGDKWEYIEGRWITGDTHDERVAAREDSPGFPRLPGVYGPYDRIEDTK